MTAVRVPLIVAHWAFEVVACLILLAVVAAVALLAWGYLMDCTISLVRRRSHTPGRARPAAAAAPRPVMNRNGSP